MKLKYIMLYVFAIIVMISGAIGYKIYNNFDDMKARWNAKIEEARKNTEEAEKKNVDAQIERVKAEITAKYEEQERIRKELADHVKQKEKELNEKGIYRAEAVPDGVKIIKEDTEKEAEKVAEPVEVEKPKTETKPYVSKSSYTAEEVKAAKDYVGNYRYIQREMNKIVLRCVENKSKETLAECELDARKRFNMSTDPVSIKRMQEKYEHELSIVKTGV